MFGQQNQQQSSGGLFGAAPQLGQSTGGFTFNAATGTGSTAGAGSTARSTGFGFAASTQQSGEKYIKYCEVHE